MGDTIIITIITIIIVHIRLYHKSTSILDEEPLNLVITEL